MQSVTRDTIKKMFKKVKKLYIPENLESVDFGPLVYYSWYDIGQEVLYAISDVRDKNKIEGIRFDIHISGNSVKLGYCDVCKSQRRISDTTLVTARTRSKPKDAVYRLRGRYLCLNFQECNESIKIRHLEKSLASLFSSILD